MESPKTIDFAEYQFHPEIRKASPRATALHDSELGTIGDFRLLSHRVSETVKDRTKVALIWENFKWPYLREGSSDPLHVWFYGGVFEVGGSNGAISGFVKSKMAAAAIMENSNSDISAADHPIYSVFGSRMGFSGSADRMALFLI